MGLLLSLASCKDATPIPNGGFFKSASDVALEAGNRAVFTPTIDGPLQPIAAAPYGTMSQMDGIQAISITFSKPMVALGQSAEGLASDQISLSPSVAGKLRWEGTQTLVFEPSQALPNATAYQVKVKAGLKALNGEVYKEDFTWAFETPRPQVLWTTPTDGESQLMPTAALTVAFNQPIQLSGSESLVALAATEGGGRVGVALSKKGDSTLVVRPNQALAKGKTYQLTVSKGFKGKQGALGMEADKAVSFTVHPELALVKVSQNEWEEAGSKFDPAYGISLEFSTPVRFGDLRKALSFSPEARFPMGIEARDGASGTVHRLPIQWNPETKYTLTIQNLKDTHGQTLGQTTTSFTTGAYTPFAEMKTGLMVIESEQKTMIPIRSVNVEAVKVGMQRLSADQVIPNIPVYDDFRYWRNDESQEPKPLEATTDFKIGQARNKIDAQPLDLSSVLSHKKGIVAVRMKAKLGPKPEDERDYLAMAQVTNLGITAKFSPHQNLIFVTDLKSGKPVPNAKVSIRDGKNTVKWTGQTDAQGRALAPGWAKTGIEQKEAYDEPIQFAFVEKEGDMAFTASILDEGIEPYRFEVNYEYAPKKQTFAGSIFSDRGLYRAGEKVHLKGVFRKRTDRDWQLIKEPLRALIYSPRNEIVSDRKLSPSDFGSLDFDWVSSPNADQGEYMMRIILASDTTNVNEYYGYSDQDVAKGSFRIDSFRRATFSVVARASAKNYVAGDFFDGTIVGRYLFGAAMGGQPVKYSVSQAPTVYTPTGYEDYRFGTANYNDYEDEFTGEYSDQGLYIDLVRSDEGLLLGEDGMAKFRIPLKGNALGTPVQLTFEASVTDPARQEGSGRSTVVVHPGMFYIGLKPQTTFLELKKSKEFSLDVITVDPNGAPLAGKLNLQLIKQEYNSVREVGVDGRMRWRTDLRESTKGAASVETAAGKAKRLFMEVPEAGFYVVRATGRDVRGNLIRSEAYFYATGDEYVGWERNDDDRISLVADHKTYAPGQTARIMVQSPYETCTALITVEREGVMQSWVETLTGSAPMVEVPLTEEHLPNVFVSVILLSGRTAAPTKQNDIGAPSFKVGYVELTVDPGARHLKVEVEPNAKTYRPGDEVTVNLRLTDAKGNGTAGEIAFSAADAGILNLIDYKLPDPFEAFYGARGLAVRTSDTRAILLLQRNYGDKEEDTGGGGGSTGDLRRDFRPQAYWNPTVRTDGNGRATLKFKLPESLTTFRLMATALTQGHHFGMGFQDVTVTKPLVLTPALPRFSRLDDVFEAGVLVTNTTGNQGNVTVTASGANGLALNGSNSQSVFLKHGETKEVRFAWKAHQVGTANLSFKANLGNENDGFATTLNVGFPATKLNFATFNATENSQNEALQLPNSMVAGLGSIRARVASTALVGLDGASKYLFEYPYGCLEQRTSRIRPLLLGQDVLAAFDLKALKGDQKQVIEQWTGQLRDYWTGTGFSLWTGDSEVNWYVTAYAFLAMQEAQKAGYNVPKDLMSGTQNALLEKVRQNSQKPDYYSDAVWQDARVMMLYALAKSGQVLSGELYPIAEQASNGKSKLSTEGMNQLLRTLQLSSDGGLARFKTALLNKVRGNIRVEATQAYIQAPADDDWGWLFASNTRATAQGLTALMESDASDATRQLAEKMIRYLMQQRRNGWWASTQDNVSVVEALAKYYKTFETQTPNFAAEVKVAGQSLLQQSFSGRSLQVAEQSRTLAGFNAGQQIPAVVSKSGTGRAYYSLMMEAWTRDWLPAATNGMSVNRSLERINDRGQTQGQVVPDANGVIRLRPGELIKVTIRVQSNTDRNYVVVDDALPAGLESLNTAFATTNQAATSGTGTDRWWGSFNHTEMRDDRVLLFADYLTRGEHAYTYVARATSYGDFIYPAARAEAMYQPEVNGRTRTMKLVVANQ